MTTPTTAPVSLDHAARLAAGAATPECEVQV